MIIAGFALTLLVAGCATPGGAVEDDLAAAIAAADSGAVLQLGPRRYQGPIVISKPLTILGVDGAIIVAPEDAPAITVVGTHGVTLRDFLVDGGSSGILVRRSVAVSIDQVIVEQALWHGILAQDSEIHVTGCLIRGLRAPAPQGIEIINSDGRPPSSVSGCKIEGPVFEGLVSHVSHVSFSNNEVAGSTARGVVITEMSDGIMEGNLVLDAQGSAYFCGDMSNCSIIDNNVAGVTPGDDHKSAQGHGVVVHYHSSAFVSGLNSSGVQGEQILLMLDSHLLEAPPYP